MIDHLTTYATDYDKTIAFYDAALATLGAERSVNMVASWNPEWPTQRFCAYSTSGKPVFWVSESKDAYTPRHVAFSATDTAAVDAFHAAGLKAGGSDNGAPGPRAQYSPNYYGGFLLDPDGNNVEAVHHSL